MKHSTTHMTPNEMRKPSHNLDVKLKLEMKSHHTRKYPNLDVGDTVKIYKKKTLLDNERTGVWTNEKYTVDLITETNNQKYYHLRGRERPLLRYEILKV